MELTLTTVLLYCLLGVAAGTLSGLFGVGSGVIMIPVLTLLFLYPQKDAQGMSLAVMVPMALMGAYRYQMNPEIHLDWRVIGILSVFVVVGANIGATLAHNLTNRVLQIAFAVLLVIVGIRTIFHTLNSG